MKTKFSRLTIPFLTEAGQQSDPNWLDENIATFNDVVRTPFVELAEGLKVALQPVVGDYHFPTQGIGRIKKAAHKIVSGEPCYKDWLSISASRPSDSRFERNPHLFFGILPNIAPYKGVVVAGGLFMPSGPQLKKIRNAIAADSKPLHQLFADKTFTARFKSEFTRDSISSRPPRGFDPDHPDMDWLVLKKFLVIKRLTVAEFVSANLLPSVAKDFKQLARLNRLLEPMLDS